jgi:hypothetical protein
MPDASLKKAGDDRAFDALWLTIGRTLRLLVAVALVTVLIVMLLHGLNLL